MTIQDSLNALNHQTDEERNTLQKMQDQLEQLTRAIQVQTSKVSQSQDKVIDLLISHIELKEEK